MIREIEPQSSDHLINATDSAGQIMSDKSVTHWIEDLKAGDDQSLQSLWDRYFNQLAAVARKRLGSAPRRTVDEEDIAQSVFMSLYRGVQQGRFPRLNNRDDLWQILVMLAREKVVDHLRKNGRLKRGGGNVRGDSLFARGDDLGGFDQFLGDAEDPLFLAMLDDQFQSLMSALRTDEQRQIASYRLEGYTNDEIASKLGLTMRSVERRLKIIRSVWSQQIEC